MSTDAPTAPASESATAAPEAQGCCSSQGASSASEGCCSSGSAAAPAPAEAPLQQLAPPPENDYVYDPACTDAAVRITEKASIEIKRFLTEKNVPDGCVLRVALQGGGCSGFEPHLGFDNRIDEANDVVSEQFGIPVAIDQKFLMFMQGTTIDYLDGIDRRGFKFDNPNATSSCGCGKSFSV
jgi:iron-sulfur cluster assembly protein